MKPLIVIALLSFSFFHIKAQNSSYVLTDGFTGAGKKYSSACRLNGVMSPTIYPNGLITYDLNSFSVSYIRNDQDEVENIIFEIRNRFKANEMVGILYRECLLISKDDTEVIFKHQLYNTFVSITSMPDGVYSFNFYK